MPDRSRRRKNNNKNKRKHKYSNSNQNKNNLESKNNNDDPTLQLEEACDTSDNNGKIVEAVNDSCCEFSSTGENSCENVIECVEINNNTEELRNEQQIELKPESSGEYGSANEGIVYDVEIHDKPNETNQFINPVIESSASNNVVECEETNINTNIVSGPAETDSSSDSIPDLINYIVESPENSVIIVEKDTDENNSKVNVEEKRNSVVSDADSGVEWETVNTEKSETDSPQSESILKDSNCTKDSEDSQASGAYGLTPEEESTLREYLSTLDLATQPSHVGIIEIVTDIQDITVNHEVKHRLRKKDTPDDFFSLRSGRLLDVIDEEGSNESSLSSRRHSDICDKKIVAEEHKNTEPDQRKQKPPSSHNNSLQKNIPQECVLVDAKLKGPEFTEARGDWSLKTLECMTGAETVYLTDHSSSTSSVNDLNDETDEGVETDVSIRMMTPVIEVTDTEKLLKNNFLINDEKPSPQILAEKTEKEALENSNSEPHEIIVLSTDNINTSLYVKDLDQKDELNQAAGKKSNTQYNAEIQELKSELNNAMHKLMNEVNYDSDTLSNCKENAKNTFARQDSNSSVGSSQCTAKYNPNFSSLNDVSNIVHDEKQEENNLGSSLQTSHVREVFESVTGLSSDKIRERRDLHKYQPQNLRDICVSRISHLPYGDQILEELAAVSERLQNINVLRHRPKTHTLQLLDDIPKLRTNICEMPYYPLPDVSSIEKVALPYKTKMPNPPPVNPRHSSLKKPCEDSLWTGLPTMNDRAYVCLSPSQKMLMEKTNTVITKEDASDLIDTHKRYIERRGYNEYKIKEDNPPAVPFKSKTGSRLLAIIRDPAATNNSNNLARNRSYDNIYSKRTPIINYNYQNDKPIRKHNEFRPIPPPRPKKYSTTYYESDESSDYFTDSSLRSVKSESKFYHHSTGNLCKEIEDDVQNIQQLHRRFTSKRDESLAYNGPRRPSLPKDLCEQQLEYIKQKEKEVEAEIERLEKLKLKVEPKEKKTPRAPLISEKEFTTENYTDANNYSISHVKDYSYKNGNSSEKNEKSRVSSAFSSSQEEIQREKMYSEYMTQIAERQERRQQKVIKITNKSSSKNTPLSKSTSAIDILDKKVNNPLEKEFICKARERLDKLGIKDPETEDEKDSDQVYKEPKPKEDKRVIKVIEGGSETDVKELPTHLQEFVRLTAKEKKSESPGESPNAPSGPHVVVWCAVVVLVFAIGRYLLRLIRYR